MTTDQIVPKHLKKYVVDQNYDRYTWEDQAVWRYIMRQLKNFLTVNAHEAYLEGLAKTGIAVNRIPRISEIDLALQKFGWRTVPVSGFIPPAAFMEFQSLGILPVASDMRSIEHILYTPAPDIVHEAAGHAPILIDPGFSAYLRAYSQVAKLALISEEDIKLYEAIRILSDVKEAPHSSQEEIRRAEEQVEIASKKISDVSEAGYLSRMNWWTAEYGLIGPLANPKIYGAGLLSSVGEAKHCLLAKVKKIQLDLDCIDYGYDITEKQPQLFVTPSFENLNRVLEELSQRMAYKIGGASGCAKAVKAKTVNTIQLSSGTQLSGQLVEFLSFNDSVCFLKTNGPSQISFEHKELQGHGPSYHATGYSSPIGKLKKLEKSIDKLNVSERSELKLKVGENVDLEFESGITLNGTIKNLHLRNDSIIMIALDGCLVQKGPTVLYEPSWGPFDLICGESVTSVFSGPADPSGFGTDVGFAAARVSPRKISAQEAARFELYKKIREFREKKLSDESIWKKLVQDYTANFSGQWLIGMELLEIGLMNSLDSSLCLKLNSRLEEVAQSEPNLREQILDGIKIANKAI